MPRSLYKAFPTVIALPPHPPIPFCSTPTDDNFEIPDPADLYASRYRQLLPPHPSRSDFQPQSQPPTPEPTSPTNNIIPSEYPPLRPIPIRPMPPLEEIGRHPSPPSRRPQHARSASNSSNASTSSRRERQSLPRIEEVPDLDYDTSSVSSGYLSRSDSGASSNYDAPHHFLHQHHHYQLHALYTYPLLRLDTSETSEMAQEYLKMDRREAAIRASMERTSWMIDDEGRGGGTGTGGGGRDVVEHINYVLSAWQRDR